MNWLEKLEMLAVISKSFRDAEKEAIADKSNEEKTKQLFLARRKWRDAVDRLESKK